MRSCASGLLDLRRLARRVEQHTFPPDAAPPSKTHGNVPQPAGAAVGVANGDGAGQGARVVDDRRARSRHGRGAHRTRRRRRWGPAVLVVLAALVLLVVTPTIAVHDERRDGLMHFGTLTSMPLHAQTEASQGVRVAMVELSWREFEPRRGARDDTYVTVVRDRIAALRAADRRITLGLGVHDTPDWVFDIPHSRYIDERGDEAQELNVVFNADVRAAVAGYLRELDDALDLGKIWSIRLTSGGSAEVLYPQGGGYWAYDANARGEARGLPASLRPNPLPDWRPGDIDKSDNEVVGWADWYIAALVDVVAWQREVLRDAGFAGYYEVLTPGIGVLPNEFAQAVADKLPRGLLGVGAVWDRFYRLLPRHRDVIAYVSSVADGSGSDDGCTPNDRRLAMNDSVIETWSSVRWISRIADEYGMMASGVRQALSCDLDTFYWAHDQRLWDGTVEFGDFANQIEAVNGSVSSAPPFLDGNT